MRDTVLSTSVCSVSNPVKVTAVVGVGATATPTERAASMRGPMAVAVAVSIRCCATSAGAVAATPVAMSNRPAVAATIGAAMEVPLIHP